MLWKDHLQLMRPAWLGPLQLLLQEVQVSGEQRVVEFLHLPLVLPQLVWLDQLPAWVHLRQVQ